MGIRTMQALGLAWDVKLPSAGRPDGRRLGSAAARNLGSPDAPATERPGSRASEQPG
jgi:hypothetical protein